MTELPAKREEITFEQAEGRDPLPMQLQLKEISQELRALLWAIFHDSIKQDIEYPTMGGYSFLRGRWKSILQFWHVRREHKFIDDFEDRADLQVQKIKIIFSDGDYLKILGFIEFVIRDNNCPIRLATVGQALQVGRAAYRLQDKSIIPIASEAESVSVERAFKILNSSEFRGAMEHLLKAGEALTAGSWAESVRESIHSVESVVIVMEPNAGTVARALAKLEAKKRIHPALKAGFASLYGFTNDEKGIRHPLLDAPVADVDETDALYMFGACASFVTYLIGKSKL